MNLRNWSIAIPSSFTSNLTSLIQRTNAVALIARAAAVFRVKNIYVYRDPLTTDPEVLRQVIKLLRYMNTPPYLRKTAFSIDKDLSYVGILPPLKTPLHRDWEAIKALKLPQVRLGLVKGRYFGKYIVDIGLDKYVVVKGKCSTGKIIPVLLEKVKGKYIWGRVLNEDVLDEMSIYPGYKVVRVKTQLINFLKKWDGLKISTSRKGSQISKIYKELKNDIIKSKNILILYGSFGYGLNSIFNYYNEVIENICNYNINLIADQGVATVRVEEAVLISLSILRFLEDSKSYFS